MTANCSWKEENCNLCIDFREVVCLEVTQESKAQKNSVILLCYSAHLVFSICQITSGFVVWQSSNKPKQKKSFKGGRELSFPFIAWNIRIVLLQQIFLIFKGFYFPFDLWIMPMAMVGGIVERHSSLCGIFFQEFCIRSAHFYCLWHNQSSRLVRVWKLLFLCVSQTTTTRTRHVKFLLYCSKWRRQQ